MRSNLALLLLLLVGGCSAAVYLHSQHYSALGLPAGAGDADVRRAYRQLALKLHPDKNPSRAAADRWLRVQQAYEALTDRSGSSEGGGTSSHRWQHAQQASSSRFWQAYEQQQHRRRQQQHIQSDVEDLDAGAFHRRVLVSGRGGGPGSGGAWLLQVFSHSSPYCRVLAPHWEEAARQMGEVLAFARIDAGSQPMLVRFVASHLRLFRSQHPSPIDLPAVFGLPSGCASMACAVVYSGRFTAQGLQRFAAAELLHLPRLPPLSRRLVGAWRARARAAGRVAVLLLLREGQAPPPALAGAVARAAGRVQAAYAVWRPADAVAWAAATGATGAPALVFFLGQEQPPVVVQGDSISFAAEVEHHSWQAVPPLHAASAHQLPACQPGMGADGAASSAPGAPPEALCVLLLARGGRQALAEARGQLEALHEQLVGHGARRHAAPEMRQAARALSGGRLQLAWAHAAQQAELCRHLLRWSQGAVAAACLCGPWWQRLPLAALRQCSVRQPPPALVAYRHQQRQRQSGGRFGGGSSRRTSQLLVASYPGSLVEPQQLAAWLAAAAAAAAAGGDTGGPSRQQVLQLVPPFSEQLAEEGSWHGGEALLLSALHCASQAELAWRRVAAAAGAALGFASWRQALAVGLLGFVAHGLKRLLDSLSREDDEGGGSSPRKAPASHGWGGIGRRRDSSGVREKSGGSTGAAVREMRHSDWDPSPGRFLVLLPLPGGGRGGSAQEQAAAAAAAAAAEQRFGEVAAAFCRERRLAFRVAPVSDALSALLHAAGASQASEPGQQRQPAALVLHPRRSHFQLVQLGEAQAAVLRLETLLDGGGEWRQAT